jgi:hypothetical protein
MPQSLMSRRYCEQLHPHLKCHAVQSLVMLTYPGGTAFPATYLGDDRFDIWNIANPGRSIAEVFCQRPERPPARLTLCPQPCAEYLTRQAWSGFPGHAGAWLACAGCVPSHRRITSSLIADCVSARMRARAAAGHDILDGSLMASAWQAVAVAGLRWMKAIRIIGRE